MNKVALVTGGSRGIGLGICRSLQKEGFNLAICGRKEESQIKKTLNNLRTGDRNVLYCRADISSSTDRKNLLDKIKEKFNRLDVLVNNAGKAPDERADILEAGEESFSDLIKVNLQGPYFLTQAVAKWMIEQKSNNSACLGKIVNISSVSATVASVNRGDYCISKAGIAMATKLWAARLAEYGIFVFEVRPGIIETDMTSGVKDKYDNLISEGLLLEPRWGKPEDVGKITAMLARGDLPYSTGQVIIADGGLTASIL